MWLLYNSSIRTRKFRRDGVYYQDVIVKDFNRIDEFFVKLTIFEDPSVWFWRITGND